MNKWKMVKLEEVGKIVTGNTPSTKVREYYENSEIPFYKPNDLKKTDVVNLSVASTYIDYRAKGKLRILPKGSVLVTCIGIIGKVGVTANFESATNQQINAIIPNQNICHSKYLAYVIFSLQQYLQNKANTPVVPIINKKDFSNIQIPLPSLDEQKKIADELDKIIGLIAKRKMQIAKLDLLVKAKFVEMFGDPVNNPMGWDEILLMKLFKVCSSKRVYQTELTTTGIPFFRVSNLVEKIDSGTSTSDLFISENLYNDLKCKNLVPKENDILITTRGTLGKCYIVNAIDEFYFQDGMISWLIKNGSSSNAIYLTNLFATENIKRQINMVSKGATVNFLSLEKLKNLKILSPPLPLQNKFADYVAKVEKTKGDMENGLKHLEVLYKERMQEHFK